MPQPPNCRPANHKLVTNLHDPVIRVPPRAIDANAVQFRRPSFTPVFARSSAPERAFKMSGIRQARRLFNLFRRYRNLRNHPQLEESPSRVSWSLPMQRGNTQVKRHANAISVLRSRMRDSIPRNCSCGFLPLGIAEESRGR